MDKSKMKAEFQNSDLNLSDEDFDSMSTFDLLEIVHSPEVFKHIFPNVLPSGEKHYEYILRDILKSLIDNRANKSLNTFVFDLKKYSGQKHFDSTNWDPNDIASEDLTDEWLIGWSGLRWHEVSYQLVEYMCRHGLEVIGMIHLMGDFMFGINYEDEAEKLKYKVLIRLMDKVK